MGDPGGSATGGDFLRSLTIPARNSSSPPPHAAHQAADELVEEAAAIGGAVGSAEGMPGAPLVFLLGAFFRFGLRLLDAAGPDPGQDAGEFVGIEPDAVRLAQIDD